MRKIIFALLLLFLASCNGEKKKPVYYDLNVDTEYGASDTDGDNQERQGEEIAVPFRQENGVKYVGVKVNGIGIDMIFDTGCSSTLISVAEANYLYQKGLLNQEDILGISQSQIADGSIVEDMVVNLAQVIIGDQIICSDVQATVSANVNAPLLLGNEVLDRVATIKIDNENSLLYFTLK